MLKTLSTSGDEMIMCNNIPLIPFSCVNDGSTVLNVPSFVSYYSTGKQIWEYRGGSAYYEGQIATGQFMCHPQKVNQGWAWKTSTSEQSGCWILNSFTGMYRFALSQAPTISRNGTTITANRCSYSDNMVAPYVGTASAAELNSSYDVTYSTSNALRVTFGNIYANKFFRFQIWAWYLVQVSGSASFDKLRCLVKSGTKEQASGQEVTVVLDDTIVTCLYNSNGNQLWSVKALMNLHLPEDYSQQQVNYLYNVKYVDMPKLYVALTSSPSTASILGFGMELWPQRKAP